MREQYKNAVDMQHPSKELIEITKKRMHEAMKEQQNIDSDDKSNLEDVKKVISIYDGKGKNKGKYIKIASVTAAVAAVLIISLVINSNLNGAHKYNIEYTEVELADAHSTLQFGLIDMESKAVSIEDFDDAMGTHICELATLDGLTLKDEMAILTYNLSGDIVKGYADIQYADVTVKVDGTDSLLPSNLEQSAPIKIANVDAYFGYDTDAQMAIACFDINEVSYRIISENTTKESFAITVESMIDILQ